VSAVQSTFRFEGFTLDPARGLLQAADRPIELRPKSFALLRYLVENSSRLVSKDELIRAVWREVAVTDDSLARCISDVRSALSDTEQRIIKTVQRRGYLLTARVSRAAGEEEAPGRPSIAVLPFGNLSHDPQQDYFVDGLSEDLITALSKFPELLVIARHSAFKYKNTQLDAKQIGGELGVRYLLVGNVRRDGKSIRVSAQLVDVGTATQRWAQSYNRDLSDIFAVQDDVTQNIVVTLVAHIARSELDRAMRKPPQSLTAYEYYLRGEAAMKNPEWADWGEIIARGRAFYEQSIAGDSRYAPPFQGLAYTYLKAYLEPTSYGAIGTEYYKQETIDHALSLAQRAVDLDGRLPEAHAMLALVLHWKYRRGEAIAEFERAFALNPNFCDPRFGHALCQNGHAWDAIDYFNRIMRLDPFHSPLTYYFLGNAYYHCDRYGKALELLRTATSRSRGMLPAIVDHAAAAALLGCDEEASTAVAKVLERLPGFAITGWLDLIRMAKQEDADRLARGLRMAGLPE
jgi:TolB-like protein/Tfp pilus assembly protein PilF